MLLGNVRLWCILARRIIVVHSVFDRQITRVFHIYLTQLEWLLCPCLFLRYLNHFLPRA